MASVKKLWNFNFADLFLAQFVSDFGNAAFAVALGFWVLDMTKTAALPGGNLALMGTVEAFFALPRVLVGPFAGAVADRLSRKWIIVLADLTRGALYTAMGAMVFFHAFPFAAIFPIAILASVCDGFFGPAISAAIPDIVPAEGLTKANSARSASTTVSQLVGNSFGGVLYALFTAPGLILLNGVSFLIAAVTQLFMKIPAVARAKEQKHILREMGDGVKYTFGNRGIRSLLIMCLITNFFAQVGITLMTPLFKNTPGFGVEKYGFVMGAMMAGMVIGMVVLSIVRVKPGQRFPLFITSLVVECCLIIPIGLLPSVAPMYPLVFVAGVCNAIVNMMIQTILQATTPSENRGRVFGIVGTMAGALMPLAMAASGLIASVAGVRPTIVGAFTLLLVGTLPLLFDPHFRRFIGTDAQSTPSQEPPELAAPLPAAEP